MRPARGEAARRARLRGRGSSSLTYAGAGGQLERARDANPAEHRAPSIGGRRDPGQDSTSCTQRARRRAEPRPVYGHASARRPHGDAGCRATCENAERSAGAPPKPHTRAPFLAANQPRTSNVGRRDAFRARKAARVSRAQAADRDAGQERRAQESNAPPRLPARAAWQACRQR